MLDEAGDSAPDKPGFLASLSRAITSFVSGAGEGTVGMVTGVVAIVELGARLNPTNAVTDPQGYLSTLDGVLTGATYLATHPVQTAKTVLDWDAWAEDPARAVGRLAPELLLAIATGGASGATKASSASRRLADDIAEIGRRGPELYAQRTKAERAHELARLGYDPAKPSGKAAEFQLGAPYGAVDDWSDVTLPAGQRVAIGWPGSTGFGVPITDGVGVTGAQTWFEGLQVAPKRVVVDGESVPLPTVRTRVDIYELQIDLEATHSNARANPQFGPGGSEQVFLPDAEELVERNLPKKVGEHHFDADTARSPIEDPAFKAVDPDLPEQPLDPERAQRSGRVGGAVVGVGAGLATNTGHSEGAGEAS